MRISKGRERSGLFWATLSGRPIGTDSHGSTSSATLPFFARFNLWKRIDSDAETQIQGWQVIWRALANPNLGKEFQHGAPGIGLQAHYPFTTSASFLGFLAGDNFGPINGCFVVR